MTDFFERVADEWSARAPELAHWTMQRLVNRTDVWGRYILKKRREHQEDSPNAAITAPFRDERGKVFLTESSLEKHFKSSMSSVLGVHSTSADQTSRWLAIDIDLHEPDDLSVSAQGNFVAAQGWWSKLCDLGCDPLLLDSNGIGGYHILLLFAEPMETKSTHEFGKRLVADFAMRGLDQQPEVFPGSPQWNHYGDWLRLPGRHHTRQHYSRVWNDEPWDEDLWLEGDDAVERMLRTTPVSLALAEQLEIRRKRRTICLDFDGVIHSYRTGWCGAEVIPDPPVHGTRAAVARLRKHFRVVIHSARCRTQAGLQAIVSWLAKHDIEVDEVCAYKPPATVYVDDRAIPFRGDWDDTIADIHDFRR